MIRKLSILIVFLAIANILEARDLLIPISVSDHSAAGARIAVRLFNPSRTETVKVMGWIERGSESPELIFESLVAPRQIQTREELVDPRGRGPSSILRMTSDQAFEASVRWVVKDGCGDEMQTSLPLFAEDQARSKGVLLQLGMSDALVGFVNPARQESEVLVRLIDRRSMPVSEILLRIPGGAIREWAVGTLFGVTRADLGSAWLEYEATHPLHAYAAIGRDGGQPPAIVPAVEDLAISPAAGTRRRRAVTAPRILEPADLEVQTTLDNTQPAPGATVTYTVVAKNNGPGPLSSIQIAFTLVAGTTFVSATAAPGTTYTQSTGTWSLPSLAAGSEATLQVRATVASSPPAIENCATYASSSPTDPNATNNRSCASLSVQQLVAQTMNVVAMQWSYDVTTNGPLKTGRPVTLTIHSSDVSHGFQMFNPNSAVVVDLVLNQNGDTQTRTFTPTVAGTYRFFCTVSTCGIGHSGMSGSIVITAP